MKLYLIRFNFDLLWTCVLFCYPAYKNIYYTETTLDTFPLFPCHVIFFYLHYSEAKGEKVFHGPAGLQRDGRDVTCTMISHINASLTSDSLRMIPSVFGISEFG